MILGWHTETGQPTLAVLGLGQPTLRHQEVRGPGTGTDRKSASAAMEEDNLGSHHEVKHQEKKCASRPTGCILMHQVLGTLWTHPGSAHTAPNAKRTGNVNSDAARHGTMHPEADRHGICLPDGAWQGIFVLDAWCQHIFFLDTPCQGIFIVDAAVSGYFPSGCSRVRAFSFWTQLYQGKWHPDDAYHGTVVTLAVKARNITGNIRAAFTNTQRVPGIVTQSSSILYI